MVYAHRINPDNSRTKIYQKQITMNKQNTKMNYPDPSNFFDKSRNIITLDKPILILLTKKNEQHFFMYLGEKRDRSEIYLLFEIKYGTYLKFLMGNESLLDIVGKHKEPFLVLEKNLDGRIIDQHNSTNKDLNPRFLPTEKSYFNDYPRTIIRYELFNHTGIEDFTHEEYDAMDSIDEAYCALSYTYHLLRVTHLPEEGEPMQKTIKDIAHRDPLDVRDRATHLYLEQLEWLKDKYSPRSYEDYDPSKGIGYNFHLAMVGRHSNEYLIVESSMQDFKEGLKKERKKEMEIFSRLGVEYPEQYQIE